MNGQIARQQQFARALGPFVAAWLAAVVGYATLALIAGTFAVVALVSQRVIREVQWHHHEEETV